MKRLQGVKYSLYWKIVMKKGEKMKRRILKSAIASLLCVTMLSGCTLPGIGDVDQFLGKAPSEYALSLADTMKKVQKEVDTIADASDDAAKLMESFVIDDIYIDETLPQWDFSDALDDLADYQKDYKSAVKALEKYQKEISKGEPTKDRDKSLQAAANEYMTQALLVAEDIGANVEFCQEELTIYGDMTMTVANEDYENDNWIEDGYELFTGVQEQYAALKPVSCVQGVWDNYIDRFDVAVAGMEYANATNCTLESYVFNQLVSRLNLETMMYRNQLNKQYAASFSHLNDLCEDELGTFGKEITTACNDVKATLPQDSYMKKEAEVNVDYDVTKTICPNLYSSMDSVVNVNLSTNGGTKDVVVSVQIDGFAQSYEEKVKVSEDVTSLCIKPALLSDLPDLTNGKDTQVSLKITDASSKTTYANKSSDLEIKSIYDFSFSSDEFGKYELDDLLGWLRPEASEILSLRREAIQWLSDTYGDENGVLPGYQAAYGYEAGDFDIPAIQAMALQMAMSNMGVRYNNGSYSATNDQRILTPDAVIDSKSGICIETALTMASALQSTGMHALVILTPGHARTAVETYYGSGEYLLIETTCLPFDQYFDQGGYSGLIGYSFGMSLQSSNFITYMSDSSWDRFMEEAYSESEEMTYIIDCDLIDVLGIEGLY